MDGGLEHPILDQQSDATEYSRNGKHRAVKVAMSTVTKIASDEIQSLCGKTQWISISDLAERLFKNEAFAIIDVYTFIANFP